MREAERGLLSWDDSKGYRTLIAVFHNTKHDISWERVVFDEPNKQDKIPSRWGDGSIDMEPIDL